MAQDDDAATLQALATNGLAGTSIIQLTITAAQAAYTAAKPNRGAVLTGYDDQIQCVANATNSGGSGGLGPITVALTNNVPTY